MAHPRNNEIVHCLFYSHSMYVLYITGARYNIIFTRKNIYIVAHHY